MNPDDEVCLCFHVTRRKLANYVRIRQPRTASQLSECQGAGTGCGWCRPYLEHLWQQAQGAAAAKESPPSFEEYARGRAAYLQAGKGKAPPGAR
jgi:NAD(P)H-nitrite reductase large subunit